MFPTQEMQWRAGSGSIEFTRVGQRTVAQRARAQSPLRLLLPGNHGSASWAYTGSHGGGLVDGDCLDLRVRVGNGAVAMLLSQSATKVYRARGGDGVSAQRLHATVEGDGLLGVVPDALCCYAGSRYVQEQALVLSPTASLVLCDWLNAGRCAANERWAFDRYLSRLVIFRGDEQILHDSLLLDPAHGVLAARLGRFESLATVVLTGPLVDAAAAALGDEISAAPLSRRADLVCSASPLPGGVIVRLLATDSERMSQALRHVLRFLPDLLGDDPWARKF